MLLLKPGALGRPGTVTIERNERMKKVVAVLDPARVLPAVRYGTRALLMLALSGAILFTTSTTAQAAIPADASRLPGWDYYVPESHSANWLAPALYKSLKDWRSAKMLAVACWAKDDWATLDTSQSETSTTMAFWDPKTPRTLHLSPGICKLLDDAVSLTSVSAARAYALTTVTHEALHALGVKNEAQTDCYAVQMVPTLAKQLSLTARPSVWGSYAVKAARGAAPDGYWNSSKCRDGGKWDLLPRTRNLPAGVLFPKLPRPTTALPTAPATNIPPQPQRPAPTPPPPPAPAIVFDHTHTYTPKDILDTGFLVPSEGIGATRVEVTYSVAANSLGNWSINGSLMDMGRGGMTQRSVAAFLKPGETQVRTVDGLGGAVVTNLWTQAHIEYRTEMIESPLGGKYPISVPVVPGTLTIRIVGYR